MLFRLVIILLSLISAVPSLSKCVSRDTSCAVVLYSGAKYTMETSLSDVFVRKSYHTSHWFSTNPMLLFYIFPQPIVASLFFVYT